MDITNVYLICNLKKKVRYLIHDNLLLAEIKKMKFPFNIHLGPIEISSHLLLELLAYSIGFRYFLYLRKRTVDSISTDHRTLILIAGALGAFFFSRTIGFFDTPDFVNGNFSFAGWFSNKTILGGLLGGLFAIELCKKVIGVKKSSGDLMTYPILLAMIIGRIGCFLAGLEDGTYGNETTLPWGINFGDSLYRHPTNLYEILFLTLVWTTLLMIERKYKLADGARFKIFMFSYCIFRFFIEFIKPVQMLAFHLSSIQLASLFGILYYYKMILKPASLIESQDHA
jgi:prolipoprotein diacylglyceryltransferase